MANTITFEMTDSQVKSFESLFDDFNRTMKRINENEKSREEEMNRLRVESQLLLAQIKEEVEQIKNLHSNGRKMLWEL
ncbi:MAG: hypothetical protein ACR2HG_07870 [Pyrinomonadaceae bacterium]